MEVESGDLDSVQCSLLLTSSIKRSRTHTNQPLCNFESNIYLSPNCIEVDLCAEHLLLMLEVKRRERHMESKLYDSTSMTDLAPNLNHLEISPYAGYFLLMSEVERRECCTESKSHVG